MYIHIHKQLLQHLHLAMVFLIICMSWQRLGCKVPFVYDIIGIQVSFICYNSKTNIYLIMVGLLGFCLLT